LIQRAKTKVISLSPSKVFLIDGLRCERGLIRLESKAVMKSLGRPAKRGARPEAYRVLSGPLPLARDR
jgi:hypothetical protein